MLSLLNYLLILLKFIVAQGTLRACCQLVLLVPVDE